MAMSGTLTSYKYPTGSTTNDGNSFAGAHYSFEWTAAKKAPGVTTVTWQLWSRGRDSTPTQLWHRIWCNTIVNGTTTSIYQKDFAADGFTGAEYSFKNQLRASGSFDVTHGTDGSGSFQVYFKFAAYWYTSYHENTETATLDNNKATVTITGNANGGSGSPTQTVTVGVATALNLTTPTRSNYAFRGWNTSSNGSGTWYKNGDSITTSSNLTLYAIWGNRYYVSYNGNGKTSGTVPSNTTHYYGVSSNLASNSLTRTHTITFNGNGGTSSTSSASVSLSRDGWNTNSSGTGTTYASGAAVTNLSSTQNATVTLYAKWNAGSTVLPTATRSGYRHVGWNTNSSGTGTHYAVGASYPVTATTTLYAEWIPIGGANGQIIYVKINGKWKLSKWK